MVKKETIGKIQIGVGIAVLIMIIPFMFLIMPKITSSTSVDESGITGTMQGYNLNDPLPPLMDSKIINEYSRAYNFSNETKTLMTFELMNLHFNQVSLVLQMRLISLSIILISIILSIMLILQGLSNISKE
jgi:hypothetical protein